MFHLKKNETKTFTGDQSLILDAYRGLYFIECWGASGSSGQSSPEIVSYGGYVSGYIKIEKRRNLYLYIGAEGKEKQENPVFNGGGPGQHTGGGASDVRLIGGNWNDLESLKSRIIVAGAGAGRDGTCDVSRVDPPGSAGGIVGSPSESNSESGATQTSGGKGYNDGTFGIGGGNPVSSPEMDSNGGGGGGYYGGGNGNNDWCGSGGGGSSFISGYSGCNAVASDYTLENKHHLGHPFHFSGYWFFHSTMISGNSTMPSPNSDSNENGHRGPGAIRITMIDYIFCINSLRIRLFLNPILFCCISFINK